MPFLNMAETMIRILINDIDSPQVYSSSRIQLASLVGAQFVNNEFTMKNKYIIDLTTPSINPDPVPNEDTTNSDGWMLNLSVLRTAIFMLRNDLKLAALSAWSIKDQDVNVDLRSAAIYKKALLDDLEKMWEIDRAQYAVGVNPSCAAVLTPINIYSYIGHGQNYGLYGTASPRDYIGY